VLDLVPSAGAGWPVMCHDVDALFVGKTLEFAFPQARPRPIAASCCHCEERSGPGLDPEAIPMTVRTVMGIASLLAMTAKPNPSRVHLIALGSRACRPIPGEASTSGSLTPGIRAPWPRG
jgi:hypothetical protein